MDNGTRLGLILGLRGWCRAVKVMVSLAMALGVDRQCWVLGMWCYTIGVRRYHLLRFGLDSLQDSVSLSNRTAAVILGFRRLGMEQNYQSFPFTIR